MLENRVLELVIVLLLVMMLFGAKRLPDTARALGKSLRILKAETRAMSDEALQAGAAASGPAEVAAVADPAPAPAAAVAVSGAAPAAESGAHVEVEAR
jgi:sec-independent protein translocase protein TatA